MIVSDLAPSSLRARLRGPGLWLRTGPLVIRVSSQLAAVAEGIAQLYALHPVEAEGSFADFHVSVDRPAGLRRWVQRQVVFYLDGEPPFAPLPGQQGFPLLEWGLNWCVYSHCHQYLTLHSAVVERDGLAMILPAPSGSGKSTLCAALAFRGWRLLSDELAVIQPETGQLVALPRPISLKNRSVDVLRAFAPEAMIGRVVPDTIKGSVAHVRPPPDALARGQQGARPRWIVLPRYVADAPAQLRPLPRAKALMALLDHAFNYNLHGREGFAALARVVDACDCYEFSYGRLDDAVAVFDRLVQDARRAPAA